MDGTVLLVLSAWGPPPRPIATQAFERLRTVRQPALTDMDIDEATGLVTTMHLDQIGFLEHEAALHRLLGRGGRIAFNGHLLKPFLAGLRPYLPLEEPRRRDLALTRLAPHAILDGLDVENLVTRRGVAGFYGRGHAPLPPGGEGIVGLGPDRVPVDWVWRTPLGGEVFVHSGNDLWSIADASATNDLIARQMIGWAAAGECHP